MYLDAMTMGNQIARHEIGTYADDSAEKEHGHESHETTFKPLLAILEREAKVDDIPQQVRLS